MQARDGWTIAFGCWWTHWCWVNTTGGGSAGSFWAASGGLEHKLCTNPSDMTGEEQLHCLHPAGSCPGKVDTDPTAKHLALPCPGNTTTRAGLGSAPDCQGMVEALSTLAAPAPASRTSTPQPWTPNTQPTPEVRRRVGSHILLYLLWRTKSPREGPGRAERFGAGRGGVWSVCRLSALGQTPHRPHSRRELNLHHLKP